MAILASKLKKLRMPASKKALEPDSADMEGMEDEEEESPEHEASESAEEESAEHEEGAEDSEEPGMGDESDLEHQEDASLEDSEEGAPLDLAALSDDELLAEIHKRGLMAKLDEAAPSAASHKMPPMPARTSKYK